MSCRNCQIDLESKDSAQLTTYDCKSSFEEIFDYFSAEVIYCKTCQLYYLNGYYEDFTNTPIEVEFGDRYYIEREITEAEFNIIQEKQNSASLDIRTFGVGE